MCFRLNELEKYLDVQDILFFRSLAENQIHLEKAQNKLFANLRRQPNGTRDGSYGHSKSSEAASEGANGLTAAKAAALGSRTVVSWISWATGYSIVENDADNDGGASQWQMTADEQEALLEMLEFNPADALDFPSVTLGTSHGKGVSKGNRQNPGGVVSTFRYHLEEGSVKLFSSVRHQLMLECKYEGLSVYASERANASNAITVSLDELRIFDRFSADSSFKCILRPKLTTIADHTSTVSETFFSHSSELNGSKRQKLKSVPAAAAYAATLGSCTVEEVDVEEVDSYAFKRKKGRSGQVSSTPLFYMKLDTYNPGSVTDIAVTVRMQPLEIVYNATCIDRVLEFFKFPKALYIFSEIQMAVINSFTHLTTKQQAKLEYAFRNHRAVSLDVDIQAPILIIPEERKDSKEDKDASLLLIDFGRLHIRDRALSQIKSKALRAIDMDLDMELDLNGSVSSLSGEAEGEGGNGDGGNSYAASKAHSSRPVLHKADSFDSFDGPVEMDESEFYDEYEVGLSFVQVLLTNVASPWRSISEQKRLSMHVVDQFTLKLAASVSILQYDRTLPQLKLAASLPSLYGECPSFMYWMQWIILYLYSEADTRKICRTDAHLRVFQKLCVQDAAEGEEQWQGLSATFFLAEVLLNALQRQDHQSCFRLLRPLSLDRPPRPRRDAG